MHQEFNRGRSSSHEENSQSPLREDLETLTNEQLSELRDHFGSSLEQLEKIAEQLFGESQPSSHQEFREGIRENHTSKPTSPDPKLLWRCVTAVGAVGMVVLLSGKGGDLPSEQAATQPHSSRTPAVEKLIQNPPSAEAPSAPPQFSEINLQQIASQMGVHSLSLREIESGRQLSYRGDYSPVSPSSSIHLVIASLVLHELDRPSPRFGLDQVLSPVTRDIAADGVATGTAYTVRDALTLMLRDGNNTAANLLVRALGGPDKFNARAAGLGFEGTGFFNYLSVPDAHRSAPVKHFNKSNLVDLSEAMATIFNNGTEAGQVAQNALRSASHGLRYSNSIAHRAAYHPAVLGEVGVVEVRGRLYVVGAFVETGSVKGIKAQKVVLEHVLESVVDALERA